MSSLTMLGYSIEGIMELERLALKLAPAFTVSSLAPDTWEKTQASFETDKLIVWSGASDATIYSTAVANWYFRAWHDSIHLKYGFDFSLHGEARTCERQIAQAWQHCSRENRKLMSDLLEIEIVEQARLAVYQGIFVSNQKQFTIEQLKARHYGNTNIQQTLS